MSRVVQFLAGVTVVAAASATMDCSVGDGTDCSTCVGALTARVCASVKVPPPPTCTACGTGTLGSPGLCSAAVTAAAQANCQVCLPLLLGAGACITTSADVAPYLTANSTLSAGLFTSLSLPGTVTVVKASVSASGSVDVPAGNNVVILQSTNPIVSVNGAASTSSSKNIFQVNATLTVNAWTNAGAAKVNNNNAGTLTIGALSVGGSSSSDFAVTQDNAASVNFQSIDFGSSAGASLQVAGGSAHFGGSASASANITGSGQIQLSNGVSVDGYIPAGTTVSVDASGTNAPLVSIEGSTTFSVSGDISFTRNGGTSTSSADAGAMIAVNGGTLIAGSGSARVQPKVILQAGSSFLINTASSFRAEAVEIGASAALVIGATANRASLTVGKIAKCAGTVRINLAVSGDAFITSSASGMSAGGNGAVALSYDKSSNDVNELVKCGVEVVDSNGKKYTLTSRTSAQASAGRRLLASDGSATWGDDKMTFEMQKQTSSAAVSFAVVPLLMVSMAGLLF